MFPCHRPPLCVTTKQEMMRLLLVLCAKLQQGKNNDNTKMFLHRRALLTKQ
jgi:hypothetical protein